ncbi:MAG TPA: flagellar assembly protein A, partial [Spirochaetia bacterium]|nr:flagellar assembly protein A [Spirochaetia bacterium]
MGRARILVVEDEELVALAIKKCLEKLGYEVPAVVASGEEAVDKAESLQLDLILMDIHLHGVMSGIEAASHIRDSRNVPVVYLSAYSDADTLAKAKITEPFGFIVKPFEERSLEASVEMALSRSEGQKELQGTRDTMSAVLDSIGDAIIATESNGTIEYANDRARSLFQLPVSLPPSTSILPILKAIRTSTQEPLSSHLKEVVTEGKSVRVPNCKLGHADGSSYLLDAKLEPYQSAGGTTRGILFVFRGRESARPASPAPAAEKHGFENLIEKTERALHNAAVVKDEHPPSSAHQPSSVHPPSSAHQAAVPPVAQELPSHRPADARSADGSVEVRVSEDRMTVVANFYPPLGTGKPIMLLEVREQLIARGLSFGIDWELVTSSIETCNESHKALANIEIAHGRLPVDEISSHIEIEPALLKKESLDDPEALSVDFKALSSIQVVKKGDPLARVIPRVEGTAGIDVTGVAVAYGKSGATPVRAGKNTLTQGDAIVAGCDGKFVMGEDSFGVSEVLEIPGDVDYSTGHIDFPGDVVVLGQIKQGFKVKAGGSLTCARTIDASEISCGGDLVTEQGILGRSQSAVNVGGQVRAKYIENCTVEAAGDVFV